MPPDATLVRRHSRLNPRAVPLDGPLPRGSCQAPIPIRRDARTRRDQPLALDARREHLRQEDVCDGETLGRDEVAVGEPALRRPRVGAWPPFDGHGPALDVGPMEAHHFQARVREFV